MNNQTIETLKRIQAKRTLELPLTDHEKAVIALYGEAEAPADDDGKTLTEYDRKAKFVSEYLSPLLRAAGVNIAKAEYKHVDGHGEYVIITHTNGYTRNRDVSADSLIALVRDTICGL